MTEFQEANLKLLAERKAELKKKDFPPDIEASFEATLDLIHFMPIDPKFLAEMEKANQTI